MFKVNDKGTGTRFYIFVNRFYIIVNFEHITYFIFSVSIVDCEQVNVRRGILYNNSAIQTSSTEAYLKSSRISEMEIFAKMVNDWR